MIDCLQQFDWFLWLFVPSDMLQGRDADDQIVFVLRNKLDDIPIDDAGADLIFVDDLMMNGKIVR